MFWCIIGIYSSFFLYQCSCKIEVLISFMEEVVRRGPNAWGPQKSFCTPDGWGELILEIGTESFVGLSHWLSREINSSLQVSEGPWWLLSKLVAKPPVSLLSRLSWGTGLSGWPACLDSVRSRDPFRGCSSPKISAFLARRSQSLHYPIAHVSFVLGSSVLIWQHLLQREILGSKECAVFSDSGEVGVGRSRREPGIIDLCYGFGDLSLSSMDSLFRWLF